MTFIANLKAQTHKLILLSAKRGALPILVMLAGVGIIAFTFAIDFVGGTVGVGPLQIALAWCGLTLLIVGAVWDLTLGQKYVLLWLQERAHEKLGLAKFMSITLQLGLLVLIIRLFEVESQAFYHNIILLTFFGFCVNYFLALRYRLGFFLLLSVCGILGIFGLPNGAWLIGIGLFLIGICHLPLPFSARTGLLLLIAALLAALRTGWGGTGWTGVILPVLASMFMFRLIIYLYDLKHEKKPVHLVQSLAYFFILPNLVFPLFPAVDYKTFRRTYYDDDQYRIYQSGVNWMLRGVIHLLVYRFVNFYLVISPNDIASVSDLARFMVTNFLLLVRISGQFHLTVGMLHLFGFNLPKPWHLFYLAGSFNEFWRRSNIYWKDFMQKVFFYPAYFRLRNFGMRTRIVLSTLFVFVVTWFLHAYQWFWLRGSILLSGPDILFWVIFGLLVIANSLYESKYGRKRALGKQSWTLGDTLSRTTRTVATFSTICVLWSLWSSPSLAAWLAMWPAAHVTLGSLARFLPVFLAGFFVFFVAIVIFERMSRPIADKDLTSSRPRSFTTTALINGLAILFLFFMGLPWANVVIGSKGSEVISNLRTSRLSLEDAALLELGYYENLTTVNRFNTQLWQLYMKRPKDWVALSQTKATRLTDDFLGMELVPSTSIIFHGSKLSTNPWGMRDGNYQQTPPEDSYRIALLGGSIVMGSGVADGEAFESVLEARLNRENDRSTYASYEILNFGVGGYGPIRRLMALENKALSFGPHAVFTVAHTRDYYHAIHLLVLKSQAGVDIPYDHLREIVRKAGIDGKITQDEAARRLKPFGDEIVAWAYRRTAEICQQRGLIPVWILLPSGVGVREDEDTAKLVRFAEEAGFAVLNLLDIFEGREPESLRTAVWDWHPNSRGHRLVADRLYQELLAKNMIPFTPGSTKTSSVEAILGRKTGPFK